MNGGLIEYSGWNKDGYLKMKKRTIYFLLILTFILLVYNLSVFTAAINVREYLEGKFPSIYIIYLASLEELDADEIEFLDLLKELPETEQRVYVREVYEDGFSLELLERLKRRPEKVQNLFLNIAYPSKEEQMIWNSPLYVFGSTNASSEVKVTVNEEEVQIFDYRSGNFLTLVDIPEGEKFPIVINSDRGGERISVERTIIYPKVWEEIPVRPLTIHSNHMQPQKNQTLRVGDELRVMFQGSPGAEATFRIGDYSNKVFMKELDDVNLPLGGRGIYKGSYTIKEEDAFLMEEIPPQAITIYLHREDENTSKELPGKISFFSEFPIKVFEITDKQAKIHQVKEDSFVFQGSTLGGDGLPTEVLGYYLLPGTLFEAAGVSGEYLRVKLGEDIFLIHKNSVQKRKDITRKPYTEISKIKISERSENVVFRFNTKECVPFLIDDESGQFSLVLYGAKSIDPILFEGKSTFVHKITAETSQSEGIGVVTINMDFYHSIVGFDYWWDEKELVVSIRKPSEISKFNPLQGRNIVIDAGHGGKQPGAIGPGDIHEKDVVLEISKFLQKILEENGANIIMTRDDDVSIELDERIDIAVRNNADLFISIHANAHAVGADAINYHGHMTIYNYNHNQILAELIMDSLAGRIGLPRARVWKRSDLAVLKCPQVPSILIETAFLMHPEDNWYLLNTEYQKEFAIGIMEGIVDYLLFIKL